MTGLQYMLIQNVGNKIYVLPAWPSTWNVDCKLLAWGNTSVRLKAAGNSVKEVNVFPSSRKMDLVYPADK
jgi:alpha-L-fucosidase 2